ncbi:translocation/assembly module TamB domain-containing protein [Desulfonatronum thioautotrophicum]|uniref:translocation/assembly module TamB domain-containing protein n=1 Tax=Desulfonatronum thioautotrophicum TaxID=617001 RepID=UPI0005EAEDDF|nr:translocation/assembly module TamB domain-containing protein [Desulfonatronum thioautotrophicum]
MFAILGVFLFLRTDFGLQRLETFLNTTLADVGGQHIALSGLHGAFPFDLRLRELRIADAQGPWLESDEIELRWSGRDLLALRIRIQELSMDRVELLRLPATDEPKPEREPVDLESWEALLDFELPTAFPRAAIDNLDIRRIILAEAVAGERLVLGLSGDLDAGEHGARMNLRLDALDGPRVEQADETSLLTLRAGFATETDILDLRLAFSDPNGALAPLLGLPQATPLGVTLEGDGPPQFWDGAFSVRAGELLVLQSHLSLAWPDYPNLAWSGTLNIDSALLPELPRELLPATTFHLQAAMPRPDTFQLAEFALRNTLMDLDAHADVDLNLSTLTGQLRLDVLDTAPLAELTGMELGPGIGLGGNVSGPLTGPDIQLALHVNEVVADPVQVGGIDLNAAIRFKAMSETDVAGATRPNGQVISVAGTLIVHGLHVPDTALPPELTANFNVAYQLADHFVDVQSLALTGQDLELLAVVGYCLETTRLDALLELQPSPIQPWLDAHGLEETAGMADLRLAAQGTVQPMHLDLNLVTGLTQLSGLPEPLPQLLGEAPRLHAQFRLLPPDNPETTGPETTGPGTIQVQAMHLQAHGLELNATADFTLATGVINGQATLALPDLALASPTPDFHLAGAAAVEVHAQGDLNDNLDLRFSLHSDDLRMNDLEPFPLQLLADVRSLPATPRGRLTMSASPLRAPVLLETAFAVDNARLHITELELTLPEGAVQGQGMLDLDSQLVTAELQGRIPDITPLAALAGQTMHGALELDLTILPDDHTPNAQNARFRTSLQDVHADFGTVSGLNLGGEIQDVTGTVDGPRIMLEMAARDVHAGETQVHQLDASLDGSLARLDLRASAQGYALHPFTLRLEAVATEDPAGRTLHLNNLIGDWAGEELRLTDPVLLTLGDQEQSLSALHLQLGQATIRAKARIGEQDADMRLGVEHLPLSLFTEDVLGSLTIGAVLSGPKSGLHGDVTVLGQNLTPAIIDLERFPAMDLQADLALDGQAVSLVAQIRETQATTPLLQAQAGTAMVLGLEPAGLVVPPDAPMTASMHGTLDMGWLGEIVLPDSQLLRGALDLNLQLEGTLDSPHPQGTLQIQGASYQHLLQGVLLQDIEADVRLEDHSIQLVSLTATDGGHGRLNAHGQASLMTEENFPFAFSVHMHEMNILDSPMVQARLSRVDLDISGSSAAQEIQGLVLVDRVEIALRDIGGPQVVDLPVVEKHGPRVSPPRTDPQEPQTPDIPMNLDIDVRFPARIFVRGRGLDSEWGGNLRVTGTASEPDVRGEIQPHRGRLDLLGRRFIIDPQSVIQFAGGQPPLPFINLAASQTRRDPEGERTFTVRVSGVPPDIPPPTLTADPPLPQDEILSQMLFGRSMSRISPTQAAQLALAARELAGHGSGMDLMGTARDLLQLDDLDLVSDEGGDMVLRAGRYIHDRVYMRLDSDLKTGEETASVDVELSPRINLESTLGPRGGGLGLFWRRDY